MRRGVKFDRPFSIRVLGSIKAGKGVFIGSNVTLIGPVTIGNSVRIENNCEIYRSTLLSNVNIKSNTLLEDTLVEEKSFLGPFARVRGNTKIGKLCQIGNFVEIKNSLIGNSVRINHMAFIGDASIDDNVTIGAGVITCNHNGHEINQTLIKKGAYIGSNTNLVAPIVIAKNTTIGSGSTITSDTPEDKLVLARSKQLVVDNWKRKNSKEER
tara:strand:+ start:295 stop:930 length:636 start_codon:yes stop_codon:yes gene_type:complete